MVAVRENVIDKNRSIYLLPDVFKPNEVFELGFKLGKRFSYFIEVTLKFLTQVFLYKLIKNFVFIYTLIF